MSMCVVGSSLTGASSTPKHDIQDQESPIIYQYVVPITIKHEHTINKCHGSH